jgi:hypothetical protein
MFRFIRRLGPSVAVFLLAAGGALAQSGEWKNTAEVYFMGGAISGTTTIGPVVAQVDLSASQLINNLQFGAMLNYRGETEKYAVNADVVFMALGASREGTYGLQTTKVDADQWIVQAHGSWRTSETFETLAGLRFTSIADKVVLTPFTGNTRSAELTKSWVDPIFGMRAKVPMGKGWSVEGYGDIGGFGVGCDLTWMLQARVDWQASQVVGFGVGYRALYQDYSSGSGVDAFKWRITMQGPLAAVNVSF